MGAKVTNSGSKGIFEGLKNGFSDVKKESSLEVKKESSNISRIKRSYALTVDTIKNLERMKLDDFETGTSLESIVELAINYYYNHNHKKEK